MTFQLNSLDQINKSLLSVYLAQRPLLGPLGNIKLSDLIGMELIAGDEVKFYENMKFYLIFQAHR